jgi:hypothetical protein
MEETMEILKITKKSQHLDTLEKYCMHHHNHNNNMLNDAHTSTYNPISNTLYQTKFATSK